MFYTKSKNLTNETGMRYINGMSGCGTDGSCPMWLQGCFDTVFYWAKCCLGFSSVFLLSPKTKMLPSNNVVGVLIIFNNTFSVQRGCRPGTRPYCDSYTSEPDVCLSDTRPFCQGSRAPFTPRTSFIRL